MDNLPHLKMTDKPTPLDEYKPIQKGLDELRERVTKTHFDLATTEGEKNAREARRACVSLRTGTEAIRKKLNEDAQKHIKGVNSIAKEITAQISEIEDPLDERIKAKEEAQKAIAEAKRVAEETRVNSLKARLTHIRGYATAFYKTSAEVLTAIERVAAIDVDDSFQEFVKEAADAREDSIVKLNEALVDLQGREAESARLARVAKELKDREAKIEKDRLDAEAKQKADDERKTAIKKRINLIRRAANLIPPANSESIASQLANLRKLVIDESFAEFQQEAADEFANTTECLQAAHDAALSNEQAAAKLKKEQDEFAETQRLAKEKADADEKEAAEVRRKEKDEAFRKSEIQARITAIRQTMWIDSSQRSDELVASKRELEAMIVDDSFQEFAAEAAEAKGLAIMTHDTNIKAALAREEKEQAEATRKQQEDDLKREQFAIVEKRDREADEIHKSDRPADRYAGRYVIATVDEDGEKLDYERVGKRLVGPGDFCCWLGEPEDCSWYRDGSGAVSELNRLDVANQELLEAVNAVAATSGFPYSDGAIEAREMCAALAMKYANPSA